MENLAEINSKDLDLKYSLFLGCVIPNRYPMIEKASRTVFKKLGIKILEMEGASCCPAPGVFRSVDKAIWLTIGARNINIAQQNKADLLTLCNGCYGTLIEIDHQMKNNEEIFSRINELLLKTNRNFDGSVQVKQIMEAIYLDIGLKKLRTIVSHKLNLRVAVHYGCHLLKPSNVRPFGKNVDNPTFFDEVIEALGCQSIDYQEKFQCCGAGGGVRTGFKDLSLKFTLDKLRQIRKSGADCIVVCCPFCHLQFDLGQIEIKEMLEEDEEPFQIPILFITQLMGLSMGLKPIDLGLIKPPKLKGITPFISIEPLLKKISDIQESQKNGGD